MLMKFPYGLCDFKKIVTQGFYYCDRTGYIAGTGLLPIVSVSCVRVGILTLNGETDEGKLRLTVPNLVMRKLY